MAYDKKDVEKDKKDVEKDKKDVENDKKERRKGSEAFRDICETTR